MTQAGKSGQKLDALYNLLAGADETYRKIPQNMKMEIEKISQGLTEFGPRKLHRRGPGTEFFESRDFRPGVDEPKRINARLSGRAGKPVVIEKEAEIRQHFYLWRDASGSMDYASEGLRYTKKQAAEVMLLAFAKHLARNEEMIGVLDRKGAWRGGKASEALAHRLMDVNIMTGDMPAVERKLPRHSTVALFSDFLVDPQTVLKTLDRITGMELKGFLVMVLDPQEINFDFRGYVEFEGLEGEEKQRFKKVESLKTAYQEKMRAHIAEVQRLCALKGFRFILQRTDRPLHNALLAIYGLSSRAPAGSPAPGLG